MNQFYNTSVIKTILKLGDKFVIERLTKAGFKPLAIHTSSGGRHYRLWGQDAYDWAMSERARIDKRKEAMAAQRKVKQARKALRQVVGVSVPLGSQAVDLSPVIERLDRLEASVRELTSQVQRRMFPLVANAGPIIGNSVLGQANAYGPNVASAFGRPGDTPRLTPMMEPTDRPFPPIVAELGAALQNTDD